MWKFGQLNKIFYIIFNKNVKLYDIRFLKDNHEVKITVNTETINHVFEK